MYHVENYTFESFEAGLPTVLVVSEEEELCVRWASLIAVRGFPVRRSGSFEQALEQIAKGDIDIVICSSTLGEDKAHTLCRRVCFSKTGRYIYFIEIGSDDSADYAVESIEKGCDDYICWPTSEGGLLAARLLVAHRITGLHKVLAEKNRRLENLSENLRRESRRDHLTGLGNRLKFDEDCTKIVDIARRYGQEFVVCIADIDHFKQYNDHYGHLEGDVCLKRVSAILQNCIRLSDYIYRIGGEEFLIVFSQQSLENSYLAAERLRKAIEEAEIEHRFNGDRSYVTVTFGLAPLTAEGDYDFTLAMSRADEALYEGKSEGRNRVVLATDLEEMFEV